MLFTFWSSEPGANKHITSLSFACYGISRVWHITTASSLSSIEINYN